MADAIHFKGKIKRGKRPLEVYEKISKAIKKKGPTKNWRCMVTEDQLRISFEDDESEVFVLEINEKGEFDNFCKVGFFGCEYEERQKELYALLDALYTAKSMFRTIYIGDDYGISENYWDSKRFKLNLRELTDEELERVKRIYDDGCTTHEEMLRTIMAEDMGMTVSELRGYMNIDVEFYGELLPAIFPTLESYLYETATIGKQGRLCELSGYEYYESGNIPLSVYAFLEGIADVFFDGTGHGTAISLEKKSVMGPKAAQVGLFFREKFAPEFLKQETPLDRCIMVYRYFVSVYDYLGFKYVGRATNLKTVIDEIIERYGEEKGNIFLTLCCTYFKYISLIDDDASRKECSERFERNMKERYDKTLLDEYEEFRREYVQKMNWKFRHEMRYIIDTNGKYIDSSLMI